MILSLLINKISTMPIRDVIRIGAMFLTHTDWGVMSRDVTF